MTPADRAASAVAAIWPFQRHVRWKIVLPFGLLSVLVAISGTYLTTRVVAGSLSDRFDNQLAEAARVTADAFVRRERRHLELVRTVTFTDGVDTAVAQRDKAALDRLVLPATVNAAAERVEILDPAGRMIYGVRRGADPDNPAYGRIAAGGEDYAAWSPVKSVLAQAADANGDKFAGIVSTAGGPVFYSAGPVKQDGRLVGVVLVGTSLPSVLAGAKVESLSDVTLYDSSGAALVSTLPADGIGGQGLSPSRDAQARLGSGAVVRESKRLYGRDFDFLYGTLLIRGEVPVTYSVALPSSFITSAAAVTRWQMTALFAFATLAVLVTGWFVASALTRPIVTLAKTAEAVSAGDLSARSGVSTHDEIGLLARTFDSMTGHLQRQHLGTIKALASAIDARDPYTLGHSLRVGLLSARIGGAMGLSRVEVQHLEVGGYLHDIGKIGIRDSVLLKPDALTASERQLIEDHPLIGLRIVEPIELPEAVLQVVGAHHERLDGSGYPLKLSGEGVPIFARVGAVADVYDALITDRPYRAGMTLDAVLDMLVREADQNRLDPGVVDALTRIADEWEEFRLESLDPGASALYQSLELAS